MAVTLAFKLWVRTVLINSAVATVAISCIKGIEGLLALGITLVVGVFLTWPLLFLIVPLLKLFQRIPYGRKAKFAWITFMLALCGAGFYLVAALLLTGSFREPVLWLLLSGTTLAVVLAGLWSRQL